MAIQETRAVFDLTASTYNNDRARLIPGFAEFYGTALSLVPPRAKTILDLGAGTGLFSAMLREAFPSAHLSLVDNSEAMLAQARTRFASDRAVTFTLADYSTAPLNGPFCAVVSALSIHHLDDAQKEALTHRVFAAVKPGGVFVNAEQVAAPTPELEAAAKQQWLADVRALGATEQQIADSLLRQRQDQCTPTDIQLSWLREAGFADVHAPFQQGRFAVLFGRRPA